MEILYSVLLIWTFVGGIGAWMSVAARIEEGRRSSKYPSFFKFLLFILLGGPLVWVIGIFSAVAATLYKILE